MITFNDNFNYIIESMSAAYDVKYSLSNLAKIFDVNKLTVRNWKRQCRPPQGKSLRKVSSAVMIRLGWSFVPSELCWKDISLAYDIDTIKYHKKTKLSYLYYESKINNIEISCRLKRLRKECLFSAMDVQRLSYQFFDDSQYHISNVYLLDIEKQKSVNPSINVLKSLSIIYDTSLEFILFGKEKK